VKNMEQVADDLFLCFRLPMEPSRNPNPKPDNKYQWKPNPAQKQIQIYASHSSMLYLVRSV
jgi:hypothetical protein